MVKQRLKILDNILFITLGILVLFAWFDSQNIIAIKQIDAMWQDMALWDIFFGIMSPALFTMWIGVLAAIGLIWFIIYKDKSEALALFVTPAILIVFGFQDLIYYIISPDIMVDSIGCWADVLAPVRIISDMLGEACPTQTSFILSAALGVFIAFKAYNWLKKQKW